MSILSISSSNSKNYTAVQKNVVEDSPIIHLPSKVECDQSVCTPYQHCVQKQGAKKYDTNKVMGRKKSEEIISMNCLATEHDNVQLNLLSSVLSCLWCSANLMLIAPRASRVRSSLTLSVHCNNNFMGSWNGMNSGSICKRDMWTSHGMSHCPMGPWDGMDSGTHTHL